MSFETVLLAVLPYLLIAAGIFAIVCSLKEYPFFVEHRKARMLAGIIGKTGMKIFYVTLGLALVVMGLLFAVVGIPTDKTTETPKTHQSE